ncbi:cyclase family protein [Sciscionella marina]|uniref:cyclase family protein n=1 Tax=Sciscionella marina TaxID=508770 RepID=UPI0003675E4B|nr:cyclase family protein [Sciscionella marina]
MRIVDLSAPIDAGQPEADQISHTILSPAEGARHMSEQVRARLGLRLDPADLPDGEFLSLDTLTLTTHTGTHVDAPAHYGSTASYGVPETIDQLPLDWFYRPAVVLDISKAEGHIASADHLRDELDRVGYTPRPLDIVLLYTGAQEWAGTERYFTDFIGLDGAGVHLLLDLGVRVIGTDAFSLDAPFGDIIERYTASREPAVLWPAHVIGRDRKYCQIERLTNLDSLPPYGFRLACFPVKITGAGAGWARAVALLEES